MGWTITLASCPASCPRGHAEPHSTTSRKAQSSVDYFHTCATFKSGRCRLASTRKPPVTQPPVRPAVAAMVLPLLLQIIFLVSGAVAAATTPDARLTQRQGQEEMPPLQQLPLAAGVPTCPCTNTSLCRPVAAEHQREVFGFAVAPGTPYDRSVWSQGGAGQGWSR